MTFLYHLLCDFYSNAFGTRTFVLLNDFLFCNLDGTESKPNYAGLYNT